MKWAVLILISFCIHCKSSQSPKSDARNLEVSAPLYHKNHSNNPLFWYYWSNPNPVNFPEPGDPEDIRKMKEQEARRNIERNQNEEIRNTPSFQRHHHRNTVEPRLFD